MASPGTDRSERGVLLVVDPSSSFRMLLCTWLEHHGYRVEATGDPDRALALARELRPMAILGEHPLRLADGRTLCRVLLEDPATRAIPFVALTARALATEIADASATHARVLVKPSRLDEILRQLETVTAG